ncbi:MAG: TolC family protein [Bacteroidales bacterium]|nr:TolC family protein [Bacteroidales bacterium]MBO7646864.1 TolC family protein [Bacteroidales bacterium]
MVKSFFKKSVWLWGLLCISLTLSAQEYVTLEQCQQWAISQTSANVQKDLNDQILKTNLNNESSYLFPKLSINGRFSYGNVDVSYPHPWADDINMARMQYHIGLDFEQVVFEGFRMHFGRQFARLQNEAEIAKIDLSLNEVKDKIVSIYLNLLIVNKQMGIIKSVQNTYDEQIKRLKVMLQEGVISQNTLSQLEVEALKMQQTYDELQANRESLVSTLEILTGRDFSNTEFLMPELPDVDNLDTNARLEYKLFDNQMRQMDFQRKIYLSNSLPKVALFATGGYGRPDYQFYLSRPDWYYLAGVTLKVPLIDWARSSGFGKVIDIQKEVLASQEADFRKSNMISIKEKQNEIVRIEKLIQLDSSITAKYAELTKTYSGQLANGTVTVFDYIKQHNDELQSRMNQELHHIQLLKAKYELMALKGIL